MHLSAHLDLDVIGVETDSTLSLLLEITAPAAEGTSERRPAALQVVLDRSGSMAGPPLDGTKRALAELIDRLDSRDRFGLVAFDDEARVVVPAGQLRDKQAVKNAIDALEPGGTTDLAAGYLRGLKEARRAATETGATLVFISDGHANRGETRPEVLGSIAAKANKDGVTTSSLGYGLGYDERLLSALARHGGGNENFAEDPDAAGQALGGEVTGLLSQAAQAVTLLVTMSPAVRGVSVVNELPHHVVDEGLQVELGGLYAGEQRKLVLTFDVPRLSSLGLAQIAELTLDWVALPALEQHSATVPVHVNVVPGDQAAGRIPDPVVRTELAYLHAQQAKRAASTLLSEGDVDGAVAHLRRGRAIVGEALGAAPAELAADLHEESRALADLTMEATAGDLSRAAKTASAQSTLRSRTRGRRLTGF